MFKRTSSLLLLFALLSLVIVGCSNTDKEDTDAIADPIEDEEADTAVDPTDDEEADTVVDSTEDDATPAEGTLATFTLEELSQYNGKDGQPAYIAVNGTVYDVTGVGVWKNGDHNGYEAGNDLTEFFPHDASRLEYGEIVGTLE